MWFVVKIKRFVLIPSKRKGRELFLLISLCIPCLFVCLWRIWTVHEPGLISSGKQEGWVGRLEDTNGLSVSDPGDSLRYLAGSDVEKVTQPPVCLRHEKVKVRCREMGYNEHFDYSSLRFQFSPYIYFEPKTLFCPLPKAGSTFFTRYFIAVRRIQEVPNLSPLNFSISSANRNKQLPFSVLKLKEDRVQFLSQATKVVFTRHPFSRIFSAYIDKLFAPNVVFWKLWGLRAVRLLKDVPLIDHPCGSFVSFPDFIKLVLRGLYRKDPHTMPMDHLCQFCDVNYDVIGKLESVTTDVDFLSTKLNVSGAFIHDKNFKEYFTEDAVNDSTKDPLTTWRKEVSDCITDFEMGRLLWRKLQIRGFIDAGIGFPFTAEEMEGISLEDFRSACFEAVDNSKDKEKLKRQKQVAFEEAFSLIPDKHMIRLQRIYESDFFLLDYDNKRPSEYAPGLTLDRVQSLNWKVDWLI